MKNLLSRLQTLDHKYLYKNAPEKKEAVSNKAELAEKNKLCQVVSTQRYLLELDTIACVQKLPNAKKNKPSSHVSAIKTVNRTKKVPGKKAGKEIITADGSRITAEQMARMKKAQKVEGVGIQNARIISAEEQFGLAKDSLDQRQRHLEKLYLGTKGRKAFFTVFEKHLGRMFDARTGLVGAFGWLLGRMGISYNRSLEKKMEKQCGIKPENFRKLYGEMQKQLEKNKLQFERVEYEEAAHLGKSVEEFRKSGEYTTFASDMAMIGLSLAMNGLGLATGVTFPLIHISFKRRAFAMDANAALKYMDEGMSYTDAVKKVSEETDKSVFMAHNLMRNANVLIAGPEGKNLAHIDKRWDNFQKMKSHLSFDKNRYNLGNIEEKNMYESMGFVIDSQGLIHFKEAKKFKNILFNFWERTFGDVKDKKAYRRALKTLKKKPKKGKLSERQIIELNQEKVQAVETILELMKHENAEDFLRRYARKDGTSMQELKDAQMFGGVIKNEHRLKKKYLKHPDKMEGRIAGVRQMERFLESQRVLVRNQREFYNIKSLDSSAKTESLKKADVLYKAAVLGMLESFKSAREVTKAFPIVPAMELRNGECVLPASEHARQTKIMKFLHEFYKEKAQMGVDEIKALDAMTQDPDFRKWMKDIGEWSKLQRRDPDGYQSMECMEKITIDTARIEELADKNKGKYEFNSVAAVAPFGANKIPLGISTAWFGGAGAFNIGNIGHRTETVMTQITQIEKDPTLGIDIPITIDVPVDVTIPTTATDNLIAYGGAQAAGMLVGTTGLNKGRTKAEKRLTKDAKARYKNKRAKTS